MSQASDFLENALINYLFRAIPYSAPTTVAIGLFNTSPSDVAGSGTEIHTSGGYARLSASFGPALTGSTANLATLTFGPATLPWGTITAFAVFDNVTSGSGNMLVWNALNANIVITTGDSAQFASTSLQLTVA